MPDARDAAPASQTARRLIRAGGRAVLSTADAARSGWPYASLVLAAAGHDAAPLLLISDLARHTINIAADSRVSLLYDDTAGHDDPLAGLRATVTGQCQKTADARLRRRYLARHPSSRLYADLPDFGLYRIDIIEVHLIRGFGRIETIEGRRVVTPAAMALQDSESAIVAHLDNLDAGILARCVGPPDAPGGRWQVTGCDREGCDLRCGDQTARLDFRHPVDGAEAAHREIYRLAGPENFGRPAAGARDFGAGELEC